MKNLLENNIDNINKVIEIYEPKTLTILEGIRKTLPDAAYPCLEIEPTTTSNSWATTRGQRPRYEFQCVLTIKCGKEDMTVKYMSTLATTIVSIMTSPQNLQMRVINEHKYDPAAGLIDTYILDSLVESINYFSNKAGTMRTAEFPWFALIHETYPDSFFKTGVNLNDPTPLKPITG